MQGHFNDDDANRRDLAYELDAWERYSWRQFLRQIGRAADASELRQWEERRPEWALLGREVFSRLLTKDDLMELDEPAKWAVRVHEEANTLPEWRTLVDLCAGYRYDAGVAALAIVTQLHDTFEGELPKGQGDDEGDGDGEQQQGGGSGGGGEGDQQGQQSPGQSPGQNPGQGDGQGDGQEDGESQEDQMREAIRRAVRQAATQAQAETGERRDAMRALGVGWGDTAGLHGADTGQQAEAEAVASRLRKDVDFRAVAQLAGRMRASIKAKRASRLKGKPAELSDVILGSDIARLLPTEMAKLRRRPLRLDLLRRLAERQVAQYEVTGREVAERGPMVVAIDFSGSMAGANLVWAKAVALALASVARDQHRPFLAIAFDTDIVGRYEDTAGMDALMRFINLNCSGGTSWTVPMDDARKVIEDPKTKRFEQADVVLITDGECGTHDDWTTGWEGWRRETGVHCYGILIDDTGSGREHSAMQPLGRITDEIFPIQVGRSGHPVGAPLDKGTDDILNRFAEVL